MTRICPMVIQWALLNLPHGNTIFCLGLDMEIVACYIINGESVSPITEMIQQHHGIYMIPTA